MKTFNLKFFPKLGLFVYIFIYLIFPKLAITQNTNVDIRKDLENALNTGTVSYTHLTLPTKA